MNKFLVSSLMLSVLILSSLSLQAQPSQTIRFYGDVILNGEPAQDGLLVSAKVDGSDIAAISTTNGGYGKNPYLSPKDGLNYEGRTVRFFIQGRDTGESTPFIYSSTATRVDLDMSGDLFCGDNLCGSSESCSSCSDDCGNCAPTTSSGGSSGGGGGGGGGGGSSTLRTTGTNGTQSSSSSSSSSGCTPDWVCSDWLPCISETQQRVCVDGKRCSDDSTRPDEKRKCDIPKPAQEETTQQTQSVATESSFMDKVKSFFGITGNVVAEGEDQGSDWTMTIVVLALVAVCVALVFAFRKKQKPEQPSQ